MNTTQTLSDDQLVQKEQLSWPKNKTRLPNGKNPFPLRSEILKFFGRQS